MSLNKGAVNFILKTLLLVMVIVSDAWMPEAGAEDTQNQNATDAEDIAAPTPVLSPSPALAESNKSRGEYLVQVAACGYCHGQTPANPDSPLSGGSVIVDSYGSVTVPNITSDIIAGIGDWTELQVMNAIRASVGKNGERLSIDSHEQYRWLADEDVRQMARYLLKTKGVENQVERRSITNFTSRKWGLFSQHEPVKGYVPVLSRKAGGYYGFYLVHMVTGCSRCHSPQEQSFEKADYLAGGKSSKFKAVSSDVRSSEVLAPNIRNQDGGIAHWGDEDLLGYLKGGKSISKPSGPEICPQVYYSRLNEQDRKSVVAYLRSLQ